MDAFLRVNENGKGSFLENPHNGVDFFLRQNADGKDSVLQNPDSGVGFFFASGIEKTHF